MTIVRALLKPAGWVQCARELGTRPTKEFDQMIRPLYGCSRAVVRLTLRK